MAEVAHALQDLNDVIGRGTAESRTKALWHATDVLVEGEFSEEQIRIFGEVIARLADEIEEAARAELSRRLAHSSNAPVKVVQMLAFDDSIEVAGPVLQFSPRLDVKSLITNIRSKGQPHLLGDLAPAFGAGRGDGRTRHARQSGGRAIGRRQRRRALLRFRLPPDDQALGNRRGACRARRPAQGNSAADVPGVACQSFRRGPAQARARAPGSDEGNSGLGGPGRRQALFEIRSGAGELSRAQAGGDRSAQGRPAERKEHCGLCARAQVRGSRHRPVAALVRCRPMSSSRCSSSTTAT